MLVCQGPRDLRISLLVTIADTMTARLLVAELGRCDEFHVLQCPRDTKSILDGLAQNSPNILLIGTNSRETAIASLPLLRQVRSQHPRTRAIVLMDDSTQDLVGELFRAGVKGVFNRSDYYLERLCRCICCVSSGQIWANSEQLGFVLDVFTETASLNVFKASGEQMLTRREKEVVRLVIEGLGNREIAQQLCLSVHTVKNYLFHIFDKLGISSRTELVMYVLSNSDDSFSAATREDQPRPLKMPVRSLRPDRDRQRLAGAQVLRRIASV